MDTQREAIFNSLYNEFTRDVAPVVYKPYGKRGWKKSGREYALQREQNYKEALRILEDA